MPSIRIGFATDFNLLNELVGIGTTLPTARLDVVGAIRADNSAGSGGVSTITRYDGFSNSSQTLGNTVSIAETSKGNLNSISGEIIIPDGKTITVADGVSIGAGRLDSLTVLKTFDLPSGGTSGRVATSERGSTRYNEDLGQLEFYTGYEWRTVGSYDGSGRGRGVFGGGIDSPGTRYSLIQYINIQSTGNSLNFGNLSNSVESPGACSSSIRGLFGGGRTPTLLSAIDYITIASEGNAISFGSLTQSRIVYNATSSSTRGIFFSGFTTGNVNTIDYVEISTLGSALDFGDVKTLRRGGASFSSPTRAIYAGGYGSPGFRNEIEFLTISSKGDMIDFGDLTSGNSGCNFSCSNATRGLIGGGANSVSEINSIDFITIATTGNAINFGSLTVRRRNGLGGVSSSTRGVFAGGYTPTFTNVIDYVLIASTSNALDFGDLTSPQILRAGAALSDSHGGLGGF